MVAYAPTEEAPRGQKPKYMVALNCTEASVPAREYFFVLTDANARTGASGEGGREADSKVLGAYGRVMLNKNGKLLLGFAEDNKLVLLSTLFCTPEFGVSYTIQSANRSEERARLDYILTKQADCRLIRCVNIRRPPLEAPESDHNLAYAKVPIPRRFAPNRRKRMLIHPRLREGEESSRKMIYSITLGETQWDVSTTQSTRRIKDHKKA